MAKRPHNIAKRMDDVQPFHVMALLARARELEADGRDIVHMEIGEPDFLTPEPIVQAGVEALQAGHHHYTPAKGLPALRRAISQYYSDRFSVEVSSERIMITPGSSAALHLLMSALVNPGEQVIMADPGYPCNRNFVRLVEGETTLVPVASETGYQLTVDHLEANWTPSTKAAMVASPSNPTGTLVDEDQLIRMADFVEEKGGALLVDEIYQGLTYDVGDKTALAVSDQLFVINSFSKFFGMTGWRLGWIVVPEAYVDTLDKVAQNIYLAAPTPAQYAALAAFTPECMEILKQRQGIFRERRDYLLPALKKLGFEIPVTPQGAFYLYANCSRFTDDSYSFCLDLLEKAGVAITPGKDFGNNDPRHHVRLAYTTSLERLKEGVERINDYLSGR